MSERATPEDAFFTVATADRYEWEPVRRALAAHGYRIVHPDDVQRGDTQRGEEAWAAGWDDCLDAVFGDR